MKNVVQGQVRLYRGSPRVNEYDYDNRRYEPPDYYGSARGDHFMSVSDPNLVPYSNGVYMTQSPYSSLFAGSQLGYLGDAAAAPTALATRAEAPAGPAAEESGSGLIGTIKSCAV